LNCKEIIQTIDYEQFSWLCVDTLEDKFIRYILSIKDLFYMEKSNLLTKSQK